MVNNSSRRLNNSKGCTESLEFTPVLWLFILKKKSVATIIVINHHICFLFSSKNKTVILLLYVHADINTGELEYTVKNGVFQNSCLGCLYVHSSTTPNRVFLKPPFEGVTGHP